MPWWGWLLIGVGVVVVLPCVGCLSWLMYVGAYGPETKVYAANEVPGHFVQTMRDVGALNQGENLHFFYSDAITDIRNGFYFVSDQRVVTYNQNVAPPLTSVSFDEIEDAMLSRDTSFLNDSGITLVLEDGRMVSFPVSSEQNRDERFFEIIEREIQD